MRNPPFAKSGQHKVYEHFEKNVLKIVCYGHDERRGKTSYGDCVHPCNSRKGCEYMANKYDGNRSVPDVDIRRHSLVVANGNS